MIDTIWSEKEKGQKIARLGQDILQVSRNDLYLAMRFFSAALFSLEPAPDSGVQVMAADGSYLFYHPADLIELYQQGPEQVNRTVLHTVFHCLFCHPFPRQKRDPLYWNLACDIAAEYLIDSLLVPCVRLPVHGLKRLFYQELEAAGGVWTAERVYGFLAGRDMDERMAARLSAEFHRDDHRYWQQEPDSPRNQQQRRDWDDLREKMEAELEHFAKEASDEMKSLTELIRRENRERYDYRDFLRKFTVLREEMEVDLDTFDYIFYHYGMETYGNMPLIEPLETREVKKAEDFVIVIDTSMSCKGELIRWFLGETWNVLSEAERMSRRFHIHLIQCDDQVQEDRLITSREEMEQYLEHFTARGLGGTDFRPAFAYVEKLREQGAFTRLRGMIYFTDGYGRFPAKKPPYETAFVFMQEDYQDVDVPPWAIKLILEKPEEQGEICHEY